MAKTKPWARRIRPYCYEIGYIWICLRVSLSYKPVYDFARVVRRMFRRLVFSLFAV